MYISPEVDKDPFQEGILFLKDKDLVYLPTTMVILMFQEILFKHVFVLLESSGSSN